MANEWSGISCKCGGRPAANETGLSEAPSSVVVEKREMITGESMDSVVMAKGDGDRGSCKQGYWCDARPHNLAEMFVPSLSWQITLSVTVLYVDAPGNSVAKQRCRLLFASRRDELFETMVAADPHHRELSIHNGQYYNHSQPWISHISMQCHDASCVDLAK
jgi:hypothetical protein